MYCMYTDIYIRMLLLIERTPMLLNIILYNGQEVVHLFDKKQDDVQIYSLDRYIISKPFVWHIAYICKLDLVEMI